MARMERLLHKLHNHKLSQVYRLKPDAINLTIPTAVAHVHVIICTLFSGLEEWVNYTEAVDVNMKMSNC
jgi:hypothetical protein